MSENLTALHVGVLYFSSLTFGPLPPPFFAHCRKDHSYRQTVENRYMAGAIARSRLGLMTLLHIVTASLLVPFTLSLPNLELPETAPKAVVVAISALSLVSFVLASLLKGEH